MKSHTRWRVLLVLVGAGSLVMAGCSLVKLRGAGVPEPAPKTRRASSKAAGQRRATAARAKVAVLESRNAAGRLDELMRKLARDDEMRTPRSEAGYYMDVQEAQLRHELRGTPATLKRGSRSIVLLLPAETFFEPDEPDLKAGAGRLVTKVAGVLEEFHKTLVVVTDRTNSRQLSRGRTLAIANRLLNDGIRAERLVAVAGAGGGSVNEGDAGAIEIGLALIMGDGP